MTERQKERDSETNRETYRATEAHQVVVAACPVVLRLARML